MGCILGYLYFSQNFFQNFCNIVFANIYRPCPATFKRTFSLCSLMNIEKEFYENPPFISKQRLQAAVLKNFNYNTLQKFHDLLRKYCPI